MPTVTLSPIPKLALLDNNGDPAAKYKLFTYLAGTTTKTPTYVDAAGVTLNTNPILLDYRGEANVWVPPNLRLKYVFAPPTDTDPPSNPIWTVDNIVESLLITLYGGVDTGIANAYVLNFTSNFSAYTDGIVIYWVPSNTNTGASTLNVNGLGIVPIQNQDGTTLNGGQLIAGQFATVVYKAGAFVLLSSGLPPSLAQGSFTPTWSGFSVAPATTIFYQRFGNFVTLQFSAAGVNTGTSNATNMSITNLPGVIRPAPVNGPLIPCVITDNGASAIGAFGFDPPSGSMRFYKGTAPPSLTGFTAAGTKGFAASTTLMYVV